MLRNWIKISYVYISFVSARWNIHDNHARVCQNLLVMDVSSYRDYIFTFLHNPSVPPDNNSSKRAIRNIKIRQKVSGQFRCPNGGFIFTVLPMVTDAMLKNGQNMFELFNTFANLLTNYYNLLKKKLIFICGSEYLLTL